MQRHSLARIAITVAMAHLGGCAVVGRDHSATRSARIAVAGATVLRLDAGAGSLRVEGHTGARDVVVTGIAHAPTPRLLGAIQIVTRRVADTIFVSCTIPSAQGQPGPPPALDLRLELPSTLALNVVDSAGESVIRNVAALRIVHGNGGLDINTVSGGLDVRDGNGDMVVANIYGDVHIVDGAGSIYLTDIRGSIDIPQAGPGEIQAVGVSGDVTIGSKRSGEVAARGVGGNLAVTASGSGSIEFQDVKGKVTLPGGNH